MMSAAEENRDPALGRGNVAEGSGDDAARHPPGVDPLLGDPSRPGRPGSNFRSPSLASGGLSESASAWAGKAGAFFSSSSMRIRAAASKASVTVAEAAGGASTKVRETWMPKVAEAASKASASVKVTWDATKDNWATNVAPRMEASVSHVAKAAADTGSLLRQGFMDTKEKVKATNFGQRLGELTKAGAERSQSLVRRNEWRTKTMRAEAAGDGLSVFGVPLDEVASRWPGNPAPVPRIVALCCDYLTEHGLSAPYLFESEGDSSVVKSIMQSFDQEPDATIPEGTNPLDVAQLLMVYFKCLPDPVLTFRLFPDIVRFGGTDVAHLRRLLKTIPAVNLETLHRIICLLHKVSLRAEENKMDVQSLAAEIAPVLAWKEAPATGGHRAERVGSANSLHEARETSTAVEPSGNDDESAILKPVTAEEVNSPMGARPTTIVDVDGNTVLAAEIPLEDEQPTHDQTALVEAVMALIEQHDSIFIHNDSGAVTLVSDP